MYRTKRGRLITFTLVALALIAAIAVVVEVIYFLRIAISALGSLAALPAGYSAPRSVFTVIAIGFLAMALIQALRSILPLRGWFHENRIRRWLFETEKTILEWKTSTRTLSSSERKEAERRAAKQADSDIDGLLRFANASDRSAFFNAPIEQVCGQLSAVAEFLLSESLTESASQKDISEEILGGPAYLLTVLAGPRGSIDAVTSLRAGFGKGRDRDAEPRSRLGYHIQRNIDQLQISIASHWQRLLRGAAMAVSFVIAFTVLSQSGPDISNAVGTLDWPHKVGIALMVGLTSGYLASVLRDGVAVIERLRRP